MTGSPRPVLPITLKVVLVALVLEAAGLVTLGSFAIAATSDGQALSFGAGVTEGVVAIVLAAMLAVFASAMAKRQSWARNATIFLQLMLLPIGYFMIKAGLWWWGGPVMLLGLVTCLVLVSGPVRNVLGVE
ncbi:hypothetical protein AB0I28_31665 [Phytomonospora sp. NPDC050363]|uniref:hypothetical protein n=1 Tax=Phytomonospora sp. NPDC050363 TaxID=3155642 RepID=UPI0033E31213